MKKNLIWILTLIVVLSAGNVIAKNPETKEVPSLNSLQIMHHNNMYKGKMIFENKELLDLLKMDAKSLEKELKSGKSLAEIARKQAVSEEKMIDLLTNQANQRIDQAAKDGKITMEQASLHKDMVQLRMKNMVETKGIFTKQYRGKGNRLNEVAAILKMSEKDLISQLKEGKSIAEIAKNKGISKEKLIDELVKKDKENITKWVDKTWKVKKK